MPSYVNESPWSETQSFEVGNLLTVSAVSPPSGEEGLSRPVALEWAGGPARVEVSTSPDFSGTVWSSPREESPCQVPGLKLNESYYWRVRRETPSCEGTWATSSFSTLRPPKPQVPQPTGPADGAGCLRAPVELTWTAPDWAESYVLQIRSARTGLIVEEASTERPRHQSTTTGSLEWRVLAVGETGLRSGYSDWQFFSTFKPSCEPPGVPTLEDFEGCQANSEPRFLLGFSSAHASSYDYEVSASADFSDVLDSGTTQSKTVFFEADGPGVYYYRAKACNESGCSEWSDPESFCLSSPPAEVSILNTQEECVESPLEIQWTTDENADRYEIQIATSRAFGPDIQASGEPEAPPYSVEVPSSVEEVFVRVRSLIGREEGPWSSVYEAEMYSRTSCEEPDVPAAEPTSDNPCQRSGERTFTLQWESAEGALGYEVEVSRYPSFKDTVFATDVQSLQSTVVVPEDGREYYWRVRAVNDAGPSGWSPVETICVGQPPLPCSVMAEPTGGRDGFHIYEHALGETAGYVLISYQMYTVKDQLEVTYDGEVVATTGGLVSGTGTLWFYYEGPENGPDVCMVEITGNSNAGTQWEYTLSCPDPDWEPPSS